MQSLAMTKDSTFLLGLGDTRAKLCFDELEEDPIGIAAAAVARWRSDPRSTVEGLMKVSELIQQLQAFDLNAEIFVQISSKSFASPAWVGMMDTAGLFDEDKVFHLVVSPWEPESYLKPSGG